MSKSDQYAQALRDLETLHTEGKIDTAHYQVRKQQLLAESSKPQRGIVAKIVLFVLIVAGLLFVINLILSGAA